MDVPREQDGARPHNIFISNGLYDWTGPSVRPPVSPGLVNIDEIV